MGKADKAVLDYMRAQNRPFSAGDIETYLKKEHNFSKKDIIGALAELVERELVKEKLYGKTKIFYPVQSLEEGISQEEMQKLNAEIASRKDEAEFLKREIKELESQRLKMSAKPSRVALKREFEELNKIVTAKQAKLQTLRSQQQQGDPSTLEAQLKKIKRLVVEWRRRRSLANDMLDTVLENYEKSKREFIKELGSWDTDEDAGAVLPTGYY